MNRIVPAVLILLATAFLPACSSMKSMTGASPQLTGLLMQQLGVTEEQANGGVGSMLKLAQEKLSAGDFDQIAKAVPGSSKYLDSAKKLLGGGNVGDKAGLQSTFSKLGMSPDMVDKFKPMLTQLVSTAGGEKYGSMLANVLK